MYIHRGIIVGKWGRIYRGYIGYMHVDILVDIYTGV